MLETDLTLVASNLAMALVTSDLTLFTTHVGLFSNLAIFTVGEAVRSTCGNSHDEEEKKESRFHLSLHQTIL